MRAYRWNNLPDWFPPNGIKRRYAEQDERARQMVADVDRILVEQGFDLPYFHELKGRMSSQCHECMDILDKDYMNDPKLQRRMEELGRLNDEDYECFDALLEPVAKRLMELGYSEREITK